MYFRKSKAQIENIDNTTLFDMVAANVKNVNIVKNAKGTKKIVLSKEQIEEILRNKKIRDQFFELSHNHVKLSEDGNYFSVTKKGRVNINPNFLKKYFNDFPFCSRLEYNLIKKELNEGKMEEFVRRNPEDVFNCFLRVKPKKLGTLVSVIEQYSSDNFEVDSEIQTKFVELYFDRVRRNVMHRNDGEEYSKTEICALLLGLLGQDSKMRILKKFNLAIVEEDGSMNEELSGKLLGILLKKFNKMEKNERKNILKFLNTNTENKKINNNREISDFLFEKNRKKSFFGTHKVSAEEEGQDWLSTTKIRRDEIETDYSRFYRLSNELPENFWPEPLPGPILVNFDSGLNKNEDSKSLYDYYSENDDLIEHSSDLSELIGDFTPARSKD